MDDRFVQGLRDKGYSLEEINKVLDARESFSREQNPYFDDIEIAAQNAWEQREVRGDLIIIRSADRHDVRGAVTTLAIREGVDERPMVISSKNAEKIYVHNISPELVERLMNTIQGKTFTFGAGRCWGVDNRGQSVRVSLHTVLEVIEHGPTGTETGA